MKLSKFKSIILVTTLTLTLSGGSPALADWFPEFNQSQSVYIDPALASSQAAPIEFQSKLEAELDLLRLKTKVNTYVLAIEAQAVPVGSKPLGVRGADKAIERWGSLKDFPHDNYALIVWERRADNPAKGGIGLNASDNVVRPEVLPVLKTYMPRDPHGAILAIASGVLLSQYSSFNPLVVVGLIVFVFVLIVLLVVVVNGFAEGGVSPKEQWEKWQKASGNSQAILMEISEEGIFDFFSRFNDDEYADFQKEINERLTRFVCLSEAVTKVVDDCSPSAAEGNFRAVWKKLNSNHTVNFGKLPLEKASILKGLEDIRFYLADDLIDSLNLSTEAMLSYRKMMKACLDSPDPLKTQKQEIEKSSKPPASSSRVVYHTSPHQEPTVLSSYVFLDDCVSDPWKASEPAPSSPSSPSPDTSSSSSDYGSSGGEY